VTCKDAQGWCVILIGQTRVKFKYEHLILRKCQICGHHVPIFGPSISEPDRLFLTDLFAFGKMSGVDKNRGSVWFELGNKIGFGRSLMQRYYILPLLQISLVLDPVTKH
jgi:hypothetical protein